MSGQCASVEKKCEQVLGFESQEIINPSVGLHPYIQSHRALWCNVAGVSTLSARADECCTVMPGEGTTCSEQQLAGAQSRLQSPRPKTWDKETDFPNMFRQNMNCLDGMQKHQAFQSTKE
eukprot:1421881-Rhodomonas_salina.2